MKKFILILGLLLLVLSVALADMPEEADRGMETSENVTPEDVEQAAVMSNHFGAEVRMMQLEKSIRRNVDVGRDVLESIASEYGEEELEGLYEMLTDLEGLADEVRNKSTGDDFSRIAEEFVAIKAEARETTKQFRETSRELLTEEAREEIKGRAGERNQSEFTQDIQAQIRERINEHNAERVRDITQTMGVNATDLAEKVRNGEINVGEAVSQVASQFRGLGEENRNEAWARVNEIKAQNEVRKNEIAQNSREEASERVAKAREKAEAVRENVRGLVDRVTGGADRPDGRNSGNITPSNDARGGVKK